MILTVKNIYRNTVIAFNNSGVSLGNRTESDLLDLAIMALSSKNPNLLKLFESLPGINTLKELKMKHAEQKNKPYQSSKNS